jgi:hypothetical protein
MHSCFDANSPFSGKTSSFRGMLGVADCLCFVTGSRVALAVRAFRRRTTQTSSLSNVMSLLQAVVVLAAIDIVSGSRSGHTNRRLGIQRRVFPAMRFPVGATLWLPRWWSDRCSVSAHRRIRKPDRLWDRRTRRRLWHASSSGGSTSTRRAAT